MICLTFRAAFCVILVSRCVAVSAQESEADAAAEVEAAAADRDAAQVERCFSAPAVMDMNVISDQHVYVRTRGGNHYLMTTGGGCTNLERSYRMGDVRLVPYGRSVCQSDGSYLVYDDGGRELTCPILAVERVDDREEARLLAEGKRPLVEIEPVTPVD